MTPEEHRDEARTAYAVGAIGSAKYHATMGVLEALLQMEICGHGTRGFCKDCVRQTFLGYPIQVSVINQ